MEIYKICVMFTPENRSLYCFHSADHIFPFDTIFPLFLSTLMNEDVSNNGTFLIRSHNQIILFCRLRTKIVFTVKVLIQNAYFLYAKMYDIRVVQSRQI